VTAGQMSRVSGDSDRDAARSIGRNERRRKCQQGSEERRSEVRKEVEDNLDTVSEIWLTQCTQRSPEGSSTIMCRSLALGGSGHTSATESTTSNSSANCEISGLGN
jgi:hypothetical protein